MTTITPRDLRLNHPTWAEDRVIVINGVRYRVGRYVSRDDVYELEAVKDDT